MLLVPPVLHIGADDIRRTFDCDEIGCRPIDGNPRDFEVWTVAAAHSGDLAATRAAAQLALRDRARGRTVLRMDVEQRGGEYVVTLVFAPHQHHLEA